MNKENEIGSIEYRIKELEESHERLEKNLIIIGLLLYVFVMGYFLGSV